MNCIITNCTEATLILTEKDCVDDLLLETPSYYFDELPSHKVKKFDSPSIIAANG